MKYKLLIPVAMLLMLGACRNASSNQQEKTKEVTAAKKQNVIKKHISIPRDFSYLTNLGSVDIIYTQGNYSIDVEGDSALLEYLETTFDSNLLTVSIRMDSNTDINFYGNPKSVKMYLSCPDLKCVSICGNGSFVSEATWRAEDLQLGVLGTGDMKLGRIECTTFSIQSSDVGAITVSDLQAEDATIYSCSSAEIEANVNVENLTILNDGTQKMKLTGKATKQLIKNPKDPNLTNKIE